MEKILEKFGSTITGAQDLTGNAPPSRLFFLLGDRLSYLMAEGIDNEKSIAWRKRIHFIIKRLGANFLPCEQIFENRFFLRNPWSTEVPKDPGITLPDEAVIWMPNHGFRDDPLATVLAAQRHAYILFGSLPQFFNTVDGITAWLNGVVMINRKVSASRKLSVEKAKHVLELGTDLIMYPEGILNKSPNELILPLWPGIYQLACDTGAKIVPIIHYVRDADRRGKDNPIHTVVDDPIRIDNLSEKAALSLLRDTLATWRYLMIEAYGKSSREEILNGYADTAQAWEAHLKNLIGLMDYYDAEIEQCADYRPRSIVRPEQVWKPITGITAPGRNSILDVEYAKRIMEEAIKNDFQRRF